MIHRKHKDWFDELQPSLNLTPLLDVVFNLIFFFILATTIKESQAFLSVSLPYSDQARVQEKEPPSTLVITVNENNDIFLNNEKVDEKQLTSKLESEAQSGKVRNVVIRGDARAYHETIVEVLDACAAAHLPQVSVEVVRKPSS